MQKPYHNEPGFEREQRLGDVKAYNDIIEHETLRVAVLDMVGDTMMHASLPTSMQSLVRSMFLLSWDSYMDKCERNLCKDGLNMRDPFGDARGAFQWKHLLDSMRQLQALLSASAGNTVPAEAAEAAHARQLDECSVTSARQGAAGRHATGALAGDGAAAAAGARCCAPCPATAAFPTLSEALPMPHATSSPDAWRAKVLTEPGAGAGAGAGALTEPGAGAVAGAGAGACGVHVGHPC